MLIIATVFTACPIVAFADGTGNVEYVDVENGMGNISDVFEELEGSITDVASSDELEAALATDVEIIRIVESFTLDRTFYVTKNVALYSETAVTLTRAADFAGDLFVVGEAADGTLCEEEVTLTLGNPASQANDLLTIDGNASALTVPVVGSVLFVTAQGIVDSFANVTIQNNKKTGNERTNGDYGVSYPVRIGGSVAIVAANAEMNIYGGKYQNNGVNETADTENTATQGGAFYNFGVLYVYGGTFDGNRSTQGGVFFNYRKLYLYRAVISNNYASGLGGAIYMPNSTGAFTYIGEPNEISESAVSFTKNHAGSHGGAIYVRNYISVKNAVFTENSTDASGGAIAALTPRMTIADSYFVKNSASSSGGAIYLRDPNGKDDVLELTATGVTFEENSATSNGGALYMEESRAYLTDCDMTANTAKYGGAIYAKTSAALEINESNLTGNKGTSQGGAIGLYGGAVAVLNRVTGAENSSASGGFLYSTESELTIYGSRFQRNTSTAASAVLALYASAVTKIYGSVFEDNVAKTNAGAITVYTSGTETLIHSCTFDGNTSGNYGGALHISGKSQVQMYSITAKSNSALYGGFMYETAAGTVVTLGGLTVSGNTADNGPTIWGNTLNADLYLDKYKYLDLDVTDDWDDAYWAATIANKLTVIEQVVVVPNYHDYDGTEIFPVVPLVPSDVTTSAELERALAAGLTRICIKESFTLDRTFYIANDVTVYSDKAVTLTRAADFAGDLFVIGESANGVLCEGDVTLTLGDPASTEENLLTIDGNAANMTVDVVGSALFITEKGTVNVYSGLTVQNCKKVGNEKTNGSYGVSYPARVGGAVAIVAAKAEMNIYGGNFVSNGVNEVADADNTATQGGAIYNFGVLSVWGGTFDGNRATFGGVFFNYRKMYLYNADIKNNYASEVGGAIYMPNSTGAFTYIGEVNELVESRVSFTKNVSGGTGGAIYAKNYISIQNATFTENSAASSGGAIYASALRLFVDNASFEGNVSGKYGGAICLLTENGKDDREGEITNSVFVANTATTYGGAIYVGDAAEAYMRNLDLEGNSSKYGGAVFVSEATVDLNKATFKQNQATTNGGAVYLYTSAVGTMNDVTATENTAGSGGFMYVSGATLNLYNSTLSGNSSTGTGGAIALYDSSTSNVYNTVFENNVSNANGGALTVYTGATKTLLHSCTFTGNEGVFGGAAYVSGKSLVEMYAVIAKQNVASKGGFFYATTTGTAVTLGGAAVSGNTATDGGAIIWGNSTGAKLYIDKDKYVDLDHTGEYDAAYWTTAIYNKLTVVEQSVEVPKYLDYGNEPYEHMKDAVDVKNADELEAAILAGAKYIRVVADFELDRTFYITGETVIFSTIERTLTRAKNFGGDIFVVGENADGVSALLLGQNAKLTLGNPLSVKQNLLTIDGNRDGMEVEVYGTVFFMSYNAIVNLYENVTVQNCFKVGNERVYDEKYLISSAGRVGGSMAIVSSGILNIYGGQYLNNAVRDDVISDELGEAGRVSTNGGLIFNRANVYIWGGTFKGNHGARGGLMYNYRVVTIYNAVIEGNSASASGGAIYCPSVATCRLLIGKSNAGTDKVVFKDNTATSHGAAIYSSPMNAFVIYGATEFIGNAAGGSGGAICAYGQMTVRNTLFRENTANNRGGAIYISNSSAENVTRFVYVGNCTFEENKGLLGGAISAYAGDASFANGALLTVEDSTFTGNAALDLKGGTSTSAGGAIYLDRKSELTVNNSTFTSNASNGEAGAIYASGMSKVTVSDSTITGSTALKAGGAISARSVYFDIVNSTITNSSSATNGGAIYVSYVSAYDMNTKLTVKDSEISGNVAGGIGGAIYATKRTIENDHLVMDIRNTEISNNVAEDAAGAIYTAPGLQAYMKDITVSENQAEAEGGAFYVNGSILEIDGATIEKNTTTAGQGGAFHIKGTATVTLNQITATENSSKGAGGFLYVIEATLKIYNSTIKNHYTPGTGGAMAIYDLAQTSVYNTVFEGNRSDSTGGAVTVYTGETNTLLHSCTFTGNTASSGGAIYASGKSQVEIYAVTATQNSATKGGFLYETTTGTNVTLSGVTVSGNTATEGGAIIWGNSTGAKLFINKSNYVDTENATPDDAYWSEAIYNKLTVSEVTTAVPTYKDYAEKPDPVVPTTPQKDPVPVAPIFELAQKSSDESINSTYDKFPKLDNSSNFMSRNETYFENVNGTTVTVDSFVYPTYGIADNINVGQGLMIYQAMCYKKANPDEEVYIDIASYRFSVQAAVNINRNSRYFGYMRQLSGVDYDEYGFVRIAYLLICAAKMGIHVNVIGQIDAYPMTAGERTFEEYFTTQLGDPCDPAYVENGVVSDYLEFNHCLWPLAEKGGTDMMHTKLCAVSHYLDMNGNVGRNAVWTSSSNLDGIRSRGDNANWKLQTATIVSNHEEIYRTSVNYLRLLAEYRQQEQIYEFQDLVNRRNTEQAALILAGRGDEIPADEQIIYLGTENDDVFELYFTPMGGGLLEWDEIQNPYCKYLRKLYNSEDYITFAWNAAEYNSSYDLGQRIEEMLIAAFHNNRNPKNMVYGIMEFFDSTPFDDLVVGVDIGYKSFNELPFGEVHNKDIHMSYVENGQRYYVSILNSMNQHGGSMYYQSNFALVIKEKTCSEDSVFSTVTRYCVPCELAPHSFGEEIYTEEVTDTEHGSRYRVCECCGEREIVEVLHKESEWIVLREAVPGVNGLRYKKCLLCGDTVVTEELIAEELTSESISKNTGLNPTQNLIHRLNGALSETPHTFEAIVLLPKTEDDRGGIIFSNNRSGGEVISFELYTRGRVRLYYTNGGKTVDCVFDTDVRSTEPVHIAVTMDENNVATLYVNGEKKESRQFVTALPDSPDGYVIGGDFRDGNTQYFKGTIYSINLFGDARTAEEIRTDAKYVPTNAEGLVFSRCFNKTEESNASTLIGSTFDPAKLHTVDGVDVTPHTFEALIHVKGENSDRLGSIFSNYGKDPQNAISLEIYTKGRVRLFVNNNGVKSDCVFDANVISSKPVHVTVTVEGKEASLYVNGVFSQTLMLNTELPETDVAFVMGGDHRAANANYFRGTIYSLHAFEDVRTAIEIAEDAQSAVPADVDGLLVSKIFRKEIKQVGSAVAGEHLAGATFTAGKVNVIEGVEEMPHTFEALVQVNGSSSSRFGALISNYATNTKNAISIEIFTGGKVRLFTINNGVRSDCIFDQSILSDNPVHIAITVKGLEASLYINGEFSQTLTMAVELPEMTEALAMGGDYRDDNAQFFKGKIYAINLFSDVRSAKEIVRDVAAVAPDTADLLYSAYSYGENEMTPMYGQKFTDQLMGKTVCTLDATPLTIEAVISLPKNYGGRAGVIVGNYHSVKNPISLEIYTNGHVRFYYVNGDTTVDIFFATDVRTGGPVHIAVTVDGTLASLYVDGVLAEQKTVAKPLPESCTDFTVGGDGRVGNPQYFKGTIYSVSLFSGVRSAQEIRTDMLGVCADEALYTATYFRREALKMSAEDIHRHVQSVVDRLPGENGGVGLMHDYCADCGKDLRYAEFSADGKTNEIYDAAVGAMKQDVIQKIDKNFAATPKTFEFLLRLNPNISSRAGVLLGNYDGSSADQLNIEVYTDGKLRLYYKVNGVAYTELFETDIRSEKLMHVALAIDGLEARLYVNGALVETRTLSAAIPQKVSGLCIGGDNRSGEPQCFAGELYSVHLFDDARTEAEIGLDMIGVTSTEDGLLFAKNRMPEDR